MKLNIKALILILGLTLISIILNVFVSKSIQQKTYNLFGEDKSVLTLIPELVLVLGCINFYPLKLILKGLRAPPW